MAGLTVLLIEMARLTTINRDDHMGRIDCTINRDDHMGRIDCTINRDDHMGRIDCTIKSREAIFSLQNRWRN